MSRFLPQRKLSYAEIKLIPEALFGLFLSRIKVSFRPSCQWMPKNTSTSSFQVNPQKQSKALLIAAVINGLANRTPWSSTCLVKTLTAHQMVKKREIEHTLHIGVAKNLSNNFEAHSWLSVGTQIIIGGENLDGFHELAGFR
jgi:hypothetical protein